MGGFEYPAPGVVIPLLFLLGVLPVLVVMLTAYTKIVVVFLLLRTVLGLQQVPPTMVTNGLALVLTAFVMYPVGLQVMAGMEAAQQQKGPRQTLTVPEVVEAAREPLRAFLDKHTNARERAFFVDAARRMVGATGAQAVGPKDFVVLVPAFLVSELTEAFVIGVLLALPFVVVDLVVANVMMALGMQMMPPTTVALPLKLLLLVVLDGWSRLAHALVLNYR